jgi:hypothetical protein
MAVKKTPKPTIDAERVTQGRSEHFEIKRDDTNQVSVKRLEWIGDSLSFHQDYTDELIQLLKKL